MRFSVLLPTRNGGEMIDGCVRSVLDQRWEDMELIVSDNASEDATAEILASFEDPRLTVISGDEPVGVTENWNRCLDRSSGDHLLLVGDDDQLLPRYFERADALLRRWEDPDVLIYNGFAYAFPGFAGSPKSHYADPLYSPDAWLPEDGLLTPAQRRVVVATMFDFQFPMHLNMQTALVARSALPGLRGALFRPPFPDFYALSALMLTVDRWVMSSERLVAVGVSPKSFGRTIHSATEQAKGLDYLGIKPAFSGQLPGSEIVNGTHETLLALLEDYPELAGTEIDRAEYVVQQLYAWYVQRRLGSLSTGDVARRLRLLGPRDWVLAAGLIIDRLRPQALRRWLGIDRRDPASQLWPGMRPVPEVSDMTEFVRWIDHRRPAA